MLWDWSIAVSITLSLILGAVVASFFLHSLCNFKSKETSSLQRQVTNNRMALNVNMGVVYLVRVFNSMVEIASKVFELPGIAMQLLALSWSNRILLLLAIGAGAIATSVYNEGDTVLAAIDSSYRCAILPVVNNVLFSVLHVVNLIVATITPFYNAQFLLYRQLVRGTYQILMNCAASTLSLKTFFVGFSNVATTILQEILQFLGFQDLTAANNMLVNPFGVAKISGTIRQWLSFIPSAVKCTCDAVSPLIDAAFYGIFDLDHVDWIAHDFFNTFISAIQTFVRILPPYLSYPDFEETFFYITSGFFELGVLYDAWLAKVLQSMFEILGNKIVVDIPDAFVGQAIAHLNAAAIHGIETVTNTSLHTALPFNRITDVNYMRDVYSFDKSFAHLSLFSEVTKDIVAWSFQILVYTLMSESIIRRCQYASCVEYLNGECSVSCENGGIHIFAHKVQCPVYIDMQEKYLQQLENFNTLSRLLQGGFQNNFKTAQIDLPLEAQTLVVDVRQVSGEYLVEARLGPRVINKQLLKEEPPYDIYLKNAYVGALNPIYDSIGCAAQSLIDTVCNLLHVSIDFFNSLLWDYFFGNAFQGESLTIDAIQNILYVFLGPVFGRDYVPPSYNPVNSTWVPALRDHNVYKEWLVQNSVNRYNSINLHEHVFFQIDKFLSYSVAHVLEEETFGKTGFNAIRIVPEVLKSTVELVTDRDATEKIGCQRNYNGTLGTCTKDFVVNRALCVGSNAAGCTCNPLLDLPIANDCQCIWDIQQDVAYYTTNAVAHYCKINHFEFAFVFARRIFKGTRNIFQSLQSGNAAFPANPNKCLLDAPSGFRQQLFANTEIFLDPARYFNPKLFTGTCELQFTRDIACNAGDIIVRLADILIDFAKKQFKNVFVILGNIGTDGRLGDVDIAFDDELCNIQELFASTAGFVASLLKLPGNDIPVKILFSLLDIFNVAVEILESLKKLFTQMLAGNDLGSVLKNIAKDIVSVLFIWVRQLVKAVAVDNPASVLSTIDAVREIIDPIIDVFVWMVDVSIQFSLLIVGPPGNSAAATLDLRFQEAAATLTTIFERLVNIIFAEFIKFKNDMVNVFCDVICGIAVLIPDIKQGTSDICGDYTCPSVGSAAATVENTVSEAASTASNVFEDIGSAVSSFFGFRRRRLLSDPMDILTSEKVWNGSTTCDLMARSFQGRTHNLTTFESALFQDCLQRRIEGHSVARAFNIPYAEDMFYNWKKPYQMAFHALKLGSIYLPWYFSNQTTRQLRYDLGSAGYNADTIIKFQRKMHLHAHNTISSKHFSDMRKEPKHSPLHFVGSLHHLLFVTDWREHTALLQKSFAYLQSNNRNFSMTMPKDFRFLSRRAQVVLDAVSVSRQSTFGVYANLECPKDSLICMNCAILDNHIYAAVKQVEYAVDYYEGYYKTIVLHNFETFWENVTEYNRKYAKAFMAASNKDYGMEASLPAISFDWEAWFQGLFTGERTVSEITEGLATFINGNYTGDLDSDASQILSYDLYYYFSTQAQCDDPAVLYSSYDDRVGDGVRNVFLLFLLVPIIELIIPLSPLFWLFIITTIIIPLSYFLYMFTVYGFHPSCFGSVPTMVVNDFLVWLDREVFLDCFCAYVPSLAKQPCAQQTCDTCSASIDYHSCHDVATGFTDLGFLWHYVFFVRWWAPEWFAQLGNSNTWPLPYVFNLKGMSSLVADVNRGNAVTGKEISCFYLNIMTPISVTIFGFLALLAAVPIVRITIKAVKEMLMVIVYLFLALIYFARTFY